MIVFSLSFCNWYDGRAPSQLLNSPRLQVIQNQEATSIVQKTHVTFSQLREAIFNVILSTVVFIVYGHHPSIGLIQLTITIVIQP